MRKELYEALQIRYTKLHFTIEFLEDTVLPKNKPSALRGGIGEMLLRANCIRDRNCEECDFESECIVQRTLYSKFENKPEFVTTGESIGYVIECENYQEQFEEGENLEFQIILFGKTIVYFSQILQAISCLGAYGIGKNNSKFKIIGITNTYKKPILEGSNIYMKNFQVNKVSDYVRYRLESENGSNTLIFKTPVTLKYHNEFLQEFKIEPILNAIKRRIYMLDCFEGIESDLYNEKLQDIPNIKHQEHKFTSVERYSSRKNCKMALKGIKGRVELENVNQEILALLYVGELIHIGKNTSFGFGRYRVK